MRHNYLRCPTSSSGSIPCNPLLGSLKGYLPAKIYHASLSFVVFFLLSFVVICSLHDTYISFFSRFRSYSPMYVFFLPSTFSHLSFSSVFLCITWTFSFSFRFILLSAFYFLSSCIPSFSSDFFYPLLFLSSLAFFCLSSTNFLAFFCFLSFPVFYYIPFTLLFIFLHVCVLLLLSSCASFPYFLPLSAFSAYFSICFFLIRFSYFVFSSTLFNHLVLILDFNYSNFSLLFIFSINLCYLFPFSLAVFFTKCGRFSFFRFQHMLCGVFWFFT